MGQRDKSLTRKWAHVLKESQKSSLKPNADSHNSASWHTGTDGFLEHSPTQRSLYKGLTLQKIIPGFFGSLSYTHVNGNGRSSAIHIQGQAIFFEFYQY